MNTSVLLAIVNASASSQPPPLPPRYLGYADQSASEKSIYDAYTGGRDIYDASYHAAATRNEVVFNGYKSAQDFNHYAKGGAEQLEFMEGMEVGVDNLAQATIILVVGVAIIISNIIVLATFITMPGKN